MQNSMHVVSGIRLVVGLAALALPGFAQLPPTCPPQSSDQIVKNLVRKNAERASTLPAFKSTRSYRVDYGGLGGSRNAELIVEMQFTPPNTKTFVVLSQSGSKVLIDRVIKKLMEEEKSAFQPENQRRTALNEINYAFALDGCEMTERGPEYVLGVDPKEKSKYLYKGKIWVDANDFAVRKIEAEPAKNPSFWIKQTKIEQQYKKVDQFWLPASNHSVSSVRLGGHANLSIVYDNYRWMDPAYLRSSNKQPNN
jgi:hypothetical protein